MFLNNLIYGIYVIRYTCLAESSLDSASANATLIVQDVPNPPMLRWVTCNAKVTFTHHHLPNRFQINLNDVLLRRPPRTRRWCGCRWATTARPS